MKALFSLQKFLLEVVIYTLTKFNFLNALRRMEGHAPSANQITS